MLNVSAASTPSAALFTSPTIQRGKRRRKTTKAIGFAKKDAIRELFSDKISSPEKSTVAQTLSTKKEKKTKWDVIKLVAGEAYKAINYNGQKDASSKPKHTATRVAAIALPFIQFLIPQTQLVTSSFKMCYQIAEMTGVVEKASKEEKKTLKNAIESPITRTAIGIAVLVATYFASKVAIIVCSSLKIGLDVMDLRNNLVSDGFSKDTVLILIKLAGNVAYLALSIFDSNLALIFSVSAKLANNVFTAYCEASQGRWPEAIAALAFGALSNASKIDSINTAVHDGTLEDDMELIPCVADQAGVYNDAPDQKTQVKKEQPILYTRAVQWIKKKDPFNDDDTSDIKVSSLRDRISRLSDPEIVDGATDSRYWTLSLAGK